MVYPYDKTRRALLKLAASSAAIMSLPIGHGVANTNQNNAQRHSMIGFKVNPIKKVRIIVVGIGIRGKSAIARLVKIPGVEIVAVVDIRKDAVEWADKGIRRYMPNENPPQLFHKGEEDFNKAFEMDFDLGYICTPWNWHVPMAIKAMESGAHTAVEVPIALTLEDSWRLIHIAERRQRHCMMLENVCYGEAEMAVRNMCRHRVFGELVHGEAAYIHDLRASLVEDKVRFPRHWRLAHSLKRNGNLYPTHGLGPVFQYMDINRTDKAISLVSMSSQSAGMQSWIERYYNHKNKVKLTQGDMNTTLIKTKLGKTIMVQFSTGSPRPYTRHNLIQGTKGVFSGFPDRMALDPAPHIWDDKILKSHLKKYGHESWSEKNKISLKGGGHGGMDTVMDRHLIKNLQTGRPMDISLYDSILWSSIAPLSELSVANGSAPVDIPDFIPAAAESGPK